MWLCMNDCISSKLKEMDAIWMQYSKSHFFKFKTNTKQLCRVSRLCIQYSPLSDWSLQIVNQQPL